MRRAVRAVAEHRYAQTGLGAQGAEFVPRVGAEEAALAEAARLLDVGAHAARVAVRGLARVALLRHAVLLAVLHGFGAREAVAHGEVAAAEVARAWVRRDWISTARRGWALEEDFGLSRIHLKLHEPD